MRRRFRKRRVGKGVGVGLAAVILLGWVVSRWYVVGYSSDGHGTWVEVGAGQFMLIHTSMLSPQRSARFYVNRIDSGWGWGWPLVQIDADLEIIVPFWLLFVVSFVGTGALWRWDRPPPCFLYPVRSPALRRKRQFASLLTCSRSL